MAKHVFRFSVDEKGEFSYEPSDEPDGVWKYSKGDLIEFVSASGPFAVRFVSFGPPNNTVDLGPPIPPTSPLEKKDGEEVFLLRSVKQGKEHRTPAYPIRTEQSIVDQGRQRWGHNTEGTVGKYYLAFGVKRKEEKEEEEQLFVDSSRKAGWSC